MKKRKNKVFWEKVRRLRGETKVGITTCLRALEEGGGDLAKAKEILKRMGKEIVEKKVARRAEEGLVFAYVHPPGRIGVLVQINCETDFVARNEIFQKLGREISLQIASMNPSTVEVLLEQDYIRDPKMKIKDLINEAIAKLGENIQIKKFVRYEVGV